MIARRTCLVAAVALAGAAGGVAWLRIGEFRLRARLHLEEPVAGLGETLDERVVVEQAADSPVHAADIEPRTGLDVNGGSRRAIVAPPPARLRFHLAVPADAVLRFAFAVAEVHPRPLHAAPIRFAVAVDGGEVFARTADPARHRDRGWLDGQVDLRRWTGRQVDVAFATQLVGDGAAAGTPAWSHLRVLRQIVVDRQRAAPGAPSVIVLVVDTLRADRLGCYGAAPSNTPALDALAARGLVFENAVAQSTWTMPSVASLLTGLHPTSHGVGQDAGGGRDPGFLADALITLPEAAERTGITTVGISTNPLVSRGTNFSQGFETFVETGMEHRFRDAGRRRNWAPATYVNATFRRWLARNRGVRFLAYLHYMEPHDPYTPPRDLRPPAPPDIRPEIARGEVYPFAQALDWHGGPPLPPPEVAYLRALYDSEVREWDRAFAALLRGLDAAGVADRTVLVMTADHGEQFQEHGRLRHGVDLYDETLRVPLVIAGPGIHAGRIGPVAQGIDLFPTVASILGAAVPASLPGRNLLGERGKPRLAVAELGELRAIRRSGWKLIHASSTDRWELYDLQSDPGERENVFGRAAEGESLRTALAAWQAAVPKPPSSDGHDPRLSEKLRPLGYVQ